MFWRVFLFSGLLVLGSGCPKDPAPDDGHLQVDRVAPAGRLFDLHVRALFCADDTTLSLAGSSRDWNAAIAVRTTWPAGAREFPVDSVIAGVGTAAIGARRLGDSVNVAMTVMHGTLRLEAGSGIRGTIDVVSLDARGDSLRLHARFDAPAPKPGGCPAS